jgi:hypothetical protein
MTTPIANPAITSWDAFLATPATASEPSLV